MTIATAAKEHPMRATKALRLARAWPVVFVLLSTTAIARDLDALAAIVAPAYTAMNFAVVCLRYDPVFLAKTSGPHGTAIAYAEHIKDDAVASLSDDEASVALKAAADSARDVSLRILRALNAQDPAIEHMRIREWCGNEAKQFIRKVIEYHDNNHEELTSRLERARR